MFPNLSVLLLGNPPVMAPVPELLPAPTKVTTQPTAVVYESLEEIQEAHAMRKQESSSPSLPTSANSNKPEVGPKPDLPPKPTFLRHSQSKAAPEIPPKPTKRVTQEEPLSHEPFPAVPPKPVKTLPEEPVHPLIPPKPTTPKPLPSDTQSDEYIYEIPDQPHPPPTEQSDPPTEQSLSSMATVQPVEVLYDLPPDSLKPRPNAKPSSKLPLPLSVSIAEEVLYDLPPPPEELNVPNSPDPIAGGVSFPDPSSYCNTSEDSTFQESSLDTFYGNVTVSLDSSSDAYFGNVSNPTFTQDSVSIGSGPQDDVPTSPLPSLTYRAKFSFSATNDEEVSFTQGSMVTACSDHNSAQNGWVRVHYEDTQGWAPLDYLQPISNSAAPASGRLTLRIMVVLECSYIYF